jgi:MYXO-CTERM domain-containing protein
MLSLLIAFLPALPALAQDAPLWDDYGDVFDAGEGDTGMLEGIDVPSATGPSEVVGGTVVVDGWDDAVGIVFWGSYVGCTGTLVADDVVLTAGHCAQGISHVIVGTKDWYSDQGEMIEVQTTREYPDSWRTYDIAVLKLKEPSSYPPRPLAMDCILDDYLEAGAEVAVVGFGATNEEGTRSTSKLHEGVTVVQTPDCAEERIDGIWTGCNPNAQPAGEIGAGGNGVDACFGDSGGPLYLLTPEGDFLVGVTSRAYAGVSQNAPCREGGIYVRPDKLIEWIEEKADRRITYPVCNEPLNVSSQPLYATSGVISQTVLSIQDPEGQGVSNFSIAGAPANGVAVVSDDGLIEYQSTDGFIGTDSFVVAISDGGNPEYIEYSGKPRTVNHTVEVVVMDPETQGGCACSSTTPSAGWLAGFGLLLGLRRRR